MSLIMLTTPWRMSKMLKYSLAAPFAKPFLS
jgi:hypothetical protein